MYICLQKDKSITVFLLSIPEPNIARGGIYLKHTQTAKIIVIVLETAPL